MNLLDVVILVAVVVFGVSGYRQGFVVGALSFVGFLGGAALGANVAKPFAELIGATDNGALVGIAVVVALAVAGQILFTTLGVAIRRRVTWRPGATVDSVAGAALSALSVLLVAWLVAMAVYRSPFDGLARQVRGSEVLTTVDAGMPDPVRNAFADLRQLVDENGFPEVFAGFGGERIVPADPPAAGIALDPQVSASAASILKVRGVAESCSRRVEGSGFVFAPQRVMTNAHVVAGVAEPQVEVGRAMLDAHVVVFDPDRDVAVLVVPGLDRPPLAFQTSPDGRAGDDAAVAGYPRDGPYHVGAARIRNRQTARAPDIYSRGTVLRDIFAVRGQILPGHSGGPLLSADGTVYGVIFAAATDDPQTGYALTADEVAAPARTGLTAVADVSTQGCD